MRPRPRQERLRAVLWLRGLAVDVGVCVDEAGKERSALEIDHPSPLRRLLRALSDATDLPVLQQHRHAVAQRSARAVEQSPVGQPEPLAPDRRVREQRRESRRH